jgi:membrane associated rhomboid family serine protease
MGVSARATIETLALMAVTFAVQLVVRTLSASLESWLFVLNSPVPLFSPWTLVTSVYAHGTVMHLLGNAIVLVPFGIAVERVTNRWRFHTFFVAVGAAAGVAEMLFGILPFVGAPGVVGASGAILGLVGYAIAGNGVADSVVAGFEFDARAQAAAIAVVAAALALLMAGPGVANVGHFAGLVFGLLAGRGRLLHVDRGV